MLKILSIGNSFSCDSQTYVPQLFEAAGEDVLLGNLFIGGCPLERHLENAKTGAPAYTYYRNNVPMGSASLETGVMDENWDYITFQQASGFSGLWESYEPYLKPLADWVRAKRPKAKFLIHETWAYEIDSEHRHFLFYENKQDVMYAKLKECYARAAEVIGAQVIPCGDAVQIARSMPPFDYANGGKSLNRDGFHLDLVSGRYLAGLVWYGFFTGKDVSENPFVPCLKEYKGMKCRKPQYAPIESSYLTEDEVCVLKKAAIEALK